MASPVVAPGPGGLSSGEGGRSLRRQRCESVELLRGWFLESSNDPRVGARRF